MYVNRLLTKEMSRKFPLVHPPEPRKELLLSAASDSIYLGKTRFLKVPVFWDYHKLINPHISIVGITGSGKSYLVKTFLTRAALIWNSNALIIDWVGEYEKWVRQAGGTVIKLGEEKLNLLDLAGMTCYERIAQIMSALDILANLKDYPDERNDIEEAIELAYESFRKSNRRPSKKHIPTLADVAKLLEKSGKKKAARIVKRFLGEGGFFSGQTTLDIGALTTGGLVCLDLHSLPNEEMRSLAGLTILQFVKERMRKIGMKEEKGIELFIVLDEAWKIANDEKSDVITIVREGRKYNFALIVASQNPTDIHKTIFSNVGTMFILRLVLREFRKYVKDSLGYSDFIDSEIGKFGVGDAAVNMIFSERQAKVMTFLLDRIDGEEPLFSFKIACGFDGDSMEVEVEREQFMKMLFEFGLSDGQAQLLKNEFEKNDGVLSAESLVEALEKFGYAKSSIITFLRQLGIKERQIVVIFSLLRRRKAMKGFVDLIVGE